jgi:hypothetical protein
MLDYQHIRKIAGAIKSASTLTEAKSVAIGERLATSIAILEKLTAGFETLLAELKGENLRAAMAALSRAARQVSEFSRTPSDERTTLGRLHKLTQGIAGRVAQMNKVVKDVDALAINAKVEAAHIDVAGGSFLAFARELAQMLGSTRTILGSFGSELAGVRERVAAANSGQLAFEKRQDEAVRSIPTRLTATVDSIARHNREAVETGTAVGERTALIKGRIGDAIMALQIADITRQRLEHADHAIGVLLETLGSGDGDVPADDECRLLILATCRLQSAQLGDAAEEFDREVRQVAVSLDNLAADARTLRDLGNAAYGAADHGGGGFIAALRDQVGEALALFDDFKAARSEANRAVASVTDATASLTGHLRKVQSLEADIRIMALNTAFKCARVGAQGRALSVIAQELRAYGQSFATEAGALMAEVTSVAELAGLLVTRAGAESAEPIAEIAETMAASLATLSDVGQSLGTALATLERDSDQVTVLLEETVANITARDEIGKVLWEAADALAKIAPAADLPLPELTPRAERMLKLMERTYTMENERAVHDRVLGRSHGTALAAQQELEDVLF